MAITLYDWGKIDWNKQDVVIARELGCSRERVRQKRNDFGKGRSPHHHEHVSLFKKRLSLLNTDGMDLKQIVKDVKCSKAYAINLLGKLGKGYMKVDGRVGGKYDWDGVNWEMRDKDVARLLGVPNPATVTQHRRRLGIFKRRKNNVFVLEMKSKVGV